MNGPKDRFRVEIDDDSVYLMDGDAELVMWTGQEWREDPSIVLNIINAVNIGHTKGADAVRAALTEGMTA